MLRCCSLWSYLTIDMCNALGFHIDVKIYNVRTLQEMLMYLIGGDFHQTISYFTLKTYCHLTRRIGYFWLLGHRFRKKIQKQNKEVRFP